MTYQTSRMEVGYPISASLTTEAIYADPAWDPSCIYKTTMGSRLITPRLHNGYQYVLTGYFTTHNGSLLSSRSACSRLLCAVLAALREVRTVTDPPYTVWGV